MCHQIIFRRTVHQLKSNPSYLAKFGNRTKRICSALLLFVSCLHAQQKWSVEGAVRIALNSHPLLAGRMEHIAAVESLTTQAGLRPNPRLVFQSENWKFAGGHEFNIGTSTDQFLYGSQVIETAGKRQRRVELGQETARLANLDRELLQQQIAARVKKAYWAAVGAERVHQLWMEHQDNFRQTIAYHEARVKEGAIPEADLLRVRLEGDRFSVAAEAAALESQQAIITLLREMGRDAGEKVELSAALELGPPPPAPTAAQALEARPEIKIARKEIDRAAAELRLQRANAKPDVEVVGGYKFTEGYSSLIGGLQMALPFSNKNQGNIGAAAAEGRAAQSYLSAAEAQVRAEITAAQRDLEGKRRQLDDYLSSSRQRAAESATIAGAAYREGGADLLRLLDAERVRIDLEVLYARTLMEYRQSIVALEAALGMDPLGTNQ
jgi:outer membrane protein, heavy metal efflux system